MIFYTIEIGERVMDIIWLCFLARGHYWKLSTNYYLQWDV